MRDRCADFGAELRAFNGESEPVHLLVNIPPTIAISRRSTRSRACPPGGCGRSCPTCAVTADGPNICASGPTSPVPWKASPPLPRANTSSSRTVPPDQLMSAQLYHRPEDRHTGAQLGSGGLSADRDREVVAGPAASVTGSGRLWAAKPGVRPRGRGGPGTQDAYEQPDAPGPPGAAQPAGAPRRSRVGLELPDPFRGDGLASHRMHDILLAGGPPSSDAVIDIVPRGYDSLAVPSRAAEAAARLLH
jgi:hypothetical protein